MFDDIMNILPLLSAFFIIGISSIFIFNSFRNFFGQIKLARLITDTPTANVRSTAEGYTELKGVAKNLPNQTLVSPLTNTECCWYHVTIEQLVPDINDNNTYRSNWQVIDEHISSHFFLIEDNNETALVCPANAHIINKKQQQWQDSKLPGEKQKKPGFWRRFISNPSNKKYRFHEFLIKPNEEIYILGFFETITKDSRLISAKEFNKTLTEKRFYELKKQDHLRVNNNDINSINTALNELKQKKPNLKIISGRKLNGDPYIISNLSQNKITNRLYRKALMHIFLSVVFLIIPLTFLNYKYDFNNQQESPTQSYNYLSNEN